MGYSEKEMTELREQKLPGESLTRKPTLEERIEKFLERIKGASSPERQRQLAGELALEEQAWEESATVDLLTKLYNREGFFRELKRALQIVQRKWESKLKKLENEGLEPEKLALERFKPGVPGSLLVIDLDKFKDTNDTKGHAFGDSVLENVAEVIADTVRPGDIVCRYGGEEIVVVLMECKLDGAKGVAERIREAVPKGTGESLDGFRQNVSIGVAQMDEVTVGQLEEGNQLFYRAFQDADKALYYAKQAGRNRTAFIDNNHQLGTLEQNPDQPGRRVVRYQNPSYQGGK